MLDDDADANSCRAIAVDSQAQEYQIGCRDSENKGPIIVTAPFNINDKAARVTSSKLAANTQNTTTQNSLRNAQRLGGVGSFRSALRANRHRKHVSTSYVERQNLNIRMGNRRMTRLTNAFSKKAEIHAHMMAIYFMHYNFVRIPKDQPGDGRWRYG